ncbi:unnamed protein product [Echinostoma caproni]|uniref:G-patch domain-containing protein n=1 Tax=Echinostoma caproni TaxID=27848 RepID=A0A183ACL2_9TREM|nr:unnamed protein product [Echinostoma caproni]
MSRQPRRRILIGPNGETFNPTLKAPKSIDVEEDCKKLREAMKGLDGTQRNPYAHYRYLSRKGYNSGRGILTPTTHLNMYSPLLPIARYSVVRGGRYYDCGVVLTNEGAKNASRTLESDINDDLSGCLRNLCIALLQGDRDELTEEQVEQVIQKGVRSVVDMNKVQKDIEDLYDAGTGRVGTDEGTFIRILAKRSVWHLYMVNKRYEEVSLPSVLRAFQNRTVVCFCQTAM